VIAVILLISLCARLPRPTE